MTTIIGLPSIVGEEGHGIIDGYQLGVLVHER